MACIFAFLRCQQSLQIIVASFTLYAVKGRLGSTTKLRRHHFSLHYCLRRRLQAESPGDERLKIGLRRVDAAGIISGARCVAMLAQAIYFWLRISMINLQYNNIKLHAAVERHAN